MEVCPTRLAHLGDTLPRRKDWRLVAPCAWGAATQAYQLSRPPTHAVPSATVNARARSGHCGPCARSPSTDDLPTSRGDLRGCWCSESLPSMLPLFFFAMAGIVAQAALAACLAAACKS